MNQSHYQLPNTNSEWRDFWAGRIYLFKQLDNAERVLEAEQRFWHFQQLVDAEVRH